MDNIILDNIENHHILTKQRILAFKMTEVGDLIDFNVIESSKENIQSLPGGRSAKSLSLLCAPLSSGNTTSLSGTQDLKNTIRQEYEKEIDNIAEADDPLDVFDRYIKWTCDAYPTAQATAQSNLLPLLERATKAFVSSQQYENDVRYLKIWLLYIKLFADSPRETYAFLARHAIGENLALFYEEFASWLEIAGRWTQAEEVYASGIDKEARPAERLIRKYAEFQHRRETKAAPESDGPSSPALPRMRPALAVKVDPFASSGLDAADPQARDRALAAAPKPAKSSKAKLAIFSDGDTPPPSVLGGGGPKGWDTIGSLGERKKENKAEAKSWAGEKLDGGKKFGGPKMTIFKDERSLTNSENQISTSNDLPRQTVNPKTGRLERVFVDLESVYPMGDDKSGVEFCFEELRARHRGWLDKDWTKLRRTSVQMTAPKQQEPTIDQENAPPMDLVESSVVDVIQEASSIAESLEKSLIFEDPPVLQAPQTVRLNDDPEELAAKESAAAKAARKARKEERAANRTRKLQIMEIKAQPQTIQANLDSPTGKTKLKRMKMPEPTMTFHTKEAMNEVYDIFNQAPAPTEESAPESEEDSEDEDDDDYTSAGESTGTGRFSSAASEAGETDDGDNEYTEKTILDVTVGGITNVSGYSDFTEAAPGNFEVDDEQSGDEATQTEELTTPTESDLPQQPRIEAQAQDENAVESTRLPYRDRTYQQKGSSKLPFMTPIVEKTESSLGALTGISERQTQYTKTPSRRTHRGGVIHENEAWSSPFQDVTTELDKENIDLPQKQPNLGGNTRKALAPAKVNALQPKDLSSVCLGKETVKPVIKGPIIKDLQCNPIDDGIKSYILENIQPPLKTYNGFFDRRGTAAGRTAEIRKFIKASSSRKTGGDKTTTSIMMPPTLDLPGAGRSHAIRKELGRGAFAPVYLLDTTAHQTLETSDENAAPPARMGEGDFSTRQGTLEALKTEDPPSAWEFYMLRQAKRRLGVSRASESIISAYEMHLYDDEGFLIEEYRSQGTLLDLVNAARAETGGGMDEMLAMFFTVELLRTVEALHAKGLIHGDLKADNVLVRFDSGASTPINAPSAATGGLAPVPTSASNDLSSQYQPDGTQGWSAKGISLIDLGRGIDMKAFTPEVQFIADWKTSESDCPEMRELRPWTYQVDYHGLAGIVHSMLFGKYLETIGEKQQTTNGEGAALGSGATKTYRIRESLKRYWQTEIWGDLFALLLNPLRYVGGEEWGKMPVSKGMKDLRKRMEGWLVENGEKGVGLRGVVRRAEGMVRERKK